MEPIPETVAAVRQLDPFPGPGDLLAELTRLANRAKQVVPDLLGVSIARLDEGLTFTLVATSSEVAVLDAIQYTPGGPCVDAGLSEEVRRFDNADPLDEARWQLFAQATAARAVRSTLTLPVMRDGRVVGTVNLYGASRHAFGGEYDELAQVFGAWAPGAVANADLSFATRAEARMAPRVAGDRVAVEVAKGILAAELELDLEAAECRLRDAASRAGVTAPDLARAIVRARNQRYRRDN